MNTYTFDRYLNIRSAISPLLSPDGSRLAFLSDISGNYQVWSVSIADEPNARWPLQLSFFADKVWEIHGTNGADHLIAVSDVGGNERQQFYLISNFGADQEGNEAHAIRRLTSDDEAIHRFGAWNKEGTKVVYTSNARNSVDFDVYVMDVESAQSHLLVETSGNRSIAAWSPDGRRALMVNAVATEQIELYLVDLERATEQHVTANFSHARYESIKWNNRGVYLLTDRTDDCFALCSLDVVTGDLTPVVTADALLAGFDGQKGQLESFTVAPDDRYAVLGLNVEGYSYLFRVDLQSGEYDPIPGLPQGIVSAIKFGASSEQLVCCVQTPTENPNCWMVDLPAATIRQLTYCHRAGIDRSTFIQPDLIHYSSFDGLDIPAFFYQPMTAEPAGGYPCILYVHGGPAGQQRPDFDVRFQFFLNHGYALLVTNVRGSTGYGRRYMMLDDLDLRMDSVADLQAGVHWLRDQPQINSKRVAIYGRSYGGFMVLAAMSEYPDLFAAGIDVVGIANWVSFMERTSPWRRAHREREYGSLEHQRELLERISPIHKAEAIQVPLLVLAGDNDPRVPLFESEQIVQRVRRAGGTVEFFHYADEGHKFSKLENRIDSFTKMASFLDKYL